MDRKEWNEMFDLVQHATLVKGFIEFEKYCNQLEDRIKKLEEKQK